ncbi:MAG: hypothetical protein MZW92_63335 [Comamonadaceae bacterium]|nr:hypothetical protein [Comamonadaceae bacterium]
MVLAADLSARLGLVPAAVRRAARARWCERAGLPVRGAGAAARRALARADARATRRPRPARSASS